MRGLNLGAEELIFQWFANLANIAFGFLIGSIITGWFTIKVIVPRAMKNPDVQEIKALFKDVVEFKKLFEDVDLPEMKVLIKEGILQLKTILENQKKE